MNEELIKKYMKLLQITRDEAIDVIKTDEAIDKGSKIFELSAEQKKVEKKMRTTTSVNAYGRKVTREKKVDNDKGYLINTLVETLQKQVESLDVINPERELNFIYNNRKFKIVLSAPRK